MWNLLEFIYEYCFFVKPLVRIFARFQSGAPRICTRRCKMLPKILRAERTNVNQNKQLWFDQRTYYIAVVHATNQAITS